MNVNVAECLSFSCVAMTECLREKNLKKKEGFILVRGFGEFNSSRRGSHGSEGSQRRLHITAGQAGGRVYPEPRAR